MIKIRVMGETYPMRKALKEAGFSWLPEHQRWEKIVSEGSLDKTIDDIRPPVSLSDNQSPSLYAELRRVDLLGRQLKDGHVRIKIVERAGEESILDHFNSEMDSVMQISPVSTPPPAPTKDKKKKERPSVGVDVDDPDAGFF